MCILKLSKTNKKDVYKRQVENPNGTFPRLTLGNQGHGGDNGLASTFWLRNGLLYGV